MCEFALQLLMGPPGTRGSRVDCLGQRLSVELEEVTEPMQVLHGNFANTH